MVELLKAELVLGGTAIKAEMPGSQSRKRESSCATTVALILPLSQAHKRLARVVHWRRSRSPWLTGSNRYVTYRHNFELK